jgi:dTDP-glucose 4,6-dehydratase
MTPEKKYPEASAKPKTLLVTGGAGFIGTNFVRHILSVRPGWRIVNLDKLTYAANPANFADLSPKPAGRHRLVHGDICDQTLLDSLFTERHFDAVLHFAAESHVDRSILAPETFVKTNVLGTFRLLEASRKYLENAANTSDFVFLHISTDEVFGSLSNEGRFTERTAYNPSSPYSASKAASDHFVKAYFCTYGLPGIITNCSNNFGPYQFPEKLIPLMILNIMERKPLPVYGDGLNIRDWLYVTDHCDALLTVLERGRPGETYNIGANEEHQNIRIVHLLCDLLDSRLDRSGKNSSHQLIRFVKDRPGHDKRYAIDASKLRNELAWQRKYPFDTALEFTVDWYLNHMDWVESVRSGDYLKWIEMNYGAREEK